MHGTWNKCASETGRTLAPASATVAYPFWSPAAAAWLDGFPEYTPGLGRVKTLVVKTAEVPEHKAAMFFGGPASCLRLDPRPTNTGRPSNSSKVFVMEQRHPACRVGSDGDHCNFFCNRQT